MAGFDRLTGQEKYESGVQMFYKPALQALNADNENICVYGYAALQAYLAYGDDSFLKAAIASWEAALPAVVTDSDILAGRSAFKNVTVASTCSNGATLTGGVFHDLSTNENILGLTASATGLSASLAAATSNQTYCNYATMSAEFLRQHLYQGSGLFANMLNTQDCTLGKTTYAYDTGCVIQALSLAAALTQNTSNIAFLYDVVAGATTRNEWHDGAGVLSITENGESSAHLMRGYTELYKGNNTPTDLKSYLKSYISNQYNAVTQISTNAGSNIYGHLWNESSTGTFSNQSQVGAISALLGGIILTPDASPAAGTNGNSSSKPSGSISQGAIAGGVIGGGIAISLIIGGVWFYTRFRKRRREEEETSDPEIVATPFDLQATTGKAQRSKIPKSDHLGQTHEPDASYRSITRDPANDNTDALSSTMDAVDDLLVALAQTLETAQRGVERGRNSEESPPSYVE
ncbi:hypothetical protein V5O48_017652 [Marasmius crinis-equi]|uniref:Glycoside hydrolase family 76 protein n=1 Tax=Marasmius crinis-equi TaxID=585013 RepID=A0ABR3END2_9AGAR